MHAQIYTVFTTKLDRPGEPVAPHLAMGETFQLGPNNIPYTQLGRYRCANTPAKTLVGDRACYLRFTSILWIATANVTKNDRIN